MSRVVFVTFADKRFTPSLNRIKEEALKFNLFDEIFELNESFFDVDYYEKYKSRFKYRGFGYWMWKSHIIAEILKQLDEDDIIFYADAGCLLNYKAKIRFQQYVELVKKNEMGLLVFEQNLQENKFTKSDVFSFFNVLDNKAITNSNQIWAGAFFLRKTKCSIEFIEKWKGTCHHHFNLINDKPSITPNLTDFIEHRHDQSVFSVLSKLYQPVVLSINENYPINEDWKSMDNFPIWAKRNKEMSLFSKFTHRVKYPMRKVIRYFEKRN
jgi:hypothetical protein